MGQIWDTHINDIIMLYVFFSILKILLILKNSHNKERDICQSIKSITALKCRKWTNLGQIWDSRINDIIMLYVFFSILKILLILKNSHNKERDICQSIKSITALKCRKWTNLGQIWDSRINNIILLNFLEKQVYFYVKLNWTNN